MAKNSIAMGINVRKNKNSKSLAFGKYYPEVDTKPTLTLKGFAQHLVDHGSIYGVDIAGRAGTAGAPGNVLPLGQGEGPADQSGRLRGRRPQRRGEGHPHPLPALRRGGREHHLAALQGGLLHAPVGIPGGEARGRAGRQDGQRTGQDPLGNGRRRLQEVAGRVASTNSPTINAHRGTDPV